MEPFLSLWLPILLSAAAWNVPIIASMAMLHQKKDFIALSDEKGLDDLRQRVIKPDNYIFPDFNGREPMKSEKAKSKGEKYIYGADIIISNAPLTPAAPPQFPKHQSSA